MIGVKYGKLTVLEEYREVKSGRNRIYLKCKCECGTVTSVVKDKIRSGHTKSCGCLRKEKKPTHGMRWTRFYKIWQGIKERCHNENNQAYKDYGGRGIKVCERWQSFENFRDDMYDGYLKHVEEHGEQQTSIDRIDNDGNYMQSNCKWSTRTEQCRNRRVFSSNQSGVTGVSWDSTHNKWVSRIGLNGKQKFLGSFTDFDLAVQVRKQAEKKYYEKSIIA